MINVAVLRSTVPSTAVIKDRADISRKANTTTGRILEKTRGVRWATVGTRTECLAIHLAQVSVLLFQARIRCHRRCQTNVFVSVRKPVTLYRFSTNLQSCNNLSLHCGDCITVTFRQIFDLLYQIYKHFSYSIYLFPAVNIVYKNSPVW